VLLGIILANFPEFSLWTFQSENVQQAMDTAVTDTWVQWLLSMLIDGKFYLIFSVLFGIGFSIILENATQRSANGMRIFYRRMTVLAVIGLLHMMLLWSGDILFLYAFIHTGDYHCDNIVYSVLYVISVYPTGLMYITGLALLYRCFPHGRLWTALAYPGRMALTNYLSQSVCGILLFYGIGMGMGADIGLWPTEVLAIIVFLFQICFSALCLKLFQFGPLEWIWRMLTYGKTFPLKKH
jgi:uncharacterized protein